MFYLVVKLTKLLALPKARATRKTYRGIGIIYFRADDYTVVMETLGMNYGTKKIQRRATEIVNHMVQYMYVSRLLLAEVNCIFHFTILRMERSHCFDIINSFCSTGTLNKLKITITISSAKPSCNIFKAYLNLVC